MTEEEKIRELKQYRWLLKEERQLRDELHELRMQAVPGAIRYDGSGVHADSGDRMAEWAARVEKLERKLGLAIGKMVTQRQTIEAGIERIRDSRERIILRKHYIEGLSLGDIADREGYTRPYIYTLHRRGVRHYRARRAQ